MREVGITREEYIKKKRNSETYFNNNSIFMIFNDLKRVILSF